MHKSKGNAVSPFGTIEKYGADPTRWYMLYASPVWTPLKFDEDGIKEVQSKFFNTLKILIHSSKCMLIQIQLIQENLKLHIKI